MTDWFDLTGCTALVTGAGRGIGAAIASAVAGAGADVVLVEHPEREVGSDFITTLRATGRRVELYRQDLALTDELKGLIDEITAKVGPIDVLVNNAAVSHLERFNEVTVDRWRRLMAINLDAPFFLSQRVAEHMIACGIRGRIINLSSNNGLVAEAGLVHYNASKGAIELMTQTLATELGEHGITVNALAPGVIQTEMADDFALDWEEFRPYYLSHIPLEGRLGTVEECAQVAVFLASRAAGYITGQHIVVDGGVLASQVPRLRFMAPYRSSLISDEATRSRRDAPDRDADSL